MQDISKDIFKIDSHLLHAEAGSMLLSEPFASDRYFSRSAVLLTEHNAEGSVGFVLNKPLGKTLHDVASVGRHLNMPVYLGGPVSRDRLFYLHTLGAILPDSILIKDGVYWGGDYDFLIDMLNSGTAKPEQVRFFAGYAGWMPKQLDGELKNNFWIVTNPKSISKLLKPDDTLWEKTTKRIGDKYEFWANVPVDPNLN